MSKSPSLRRIQADIRELSLDPSDQYFAAPLESDMHEWHFTIRGAPDTDFAGGIYHGRILLPPEYPFKPPHIVFLTPSGRFETHTKICLSFSAFHPELWQPAWGIRLILEALIAFLPSPADGAIGALDWSSEERKRLAAKSKDFCCPLCGKVANLLPALKDTPAKPSRFQKEIAQLQRMQSQEHKKDEEEEDGQKTKTESKPPAPSTPVAASSNVPPSNENGAANLDEAPLSTPKQQPKTPQPTIPQVDRTPKTETVTNVVDEAAGTNEGLRIPETPTQEAGGDSDGVVREQMDEPPPPAAAAAAVQPVVAPAPPPVAPAAAAPNQMQQDETKPSWLVEPALQMAILVLSVICVLLVRKIQALCVELQALEEY